MQNLISEIYLDVLEKTYNYKYYLYISITILRVN